jgi:hypothetical protein
MTLLGRLVDTSRTGEGRQEEGVTPFDVRLGDAPLVELLLEPTEPMERRLLLKSRPPVLLLADESRRDPTERTHTGVNIRGAVN